MKHSTLLITLCLLPSALLSASDILCIGGSLVDYTIFILDKQLPALGVTKGGVLSVSTQKFDETLQALAHLPNTTPPYVDAGGSAGIVAKTLGALGSHVIFVSRSGADENGLQFRSTLQQQNVTLCGPLTSGTTGRVLCCITPDGQRSFLFSSGSNGIPQVEDLDPSLIRGTKLVHIEGYTIRNIELLEALLKLAKKNNIPISYDLGCFILVQEHQIYLKEKVLPLVDILIGNEDEMAALFGSQAEIKKSLCNLSSLTVMLQDKEGCTVFQHGTSTHYTTTTTPVVDSTGAGDCFTAGFLFGWINKWPLEKSVALGQNLGRLVVARVGTDLTPEEVRATKKPAQ